MDSREGGTASEVTYPLLVGDLGGTNVRFGLIAEAGGSPRQVETLRTADYAGLTEALADYLKGRGPSPRCGAIAVAAPLSGDAVTLTNLNWRFSVAALRHHFSLQRLLIVNDFTALAMALPLLSAAELRQLGGGAGGAGLAKGLLGPGTGLGVSGLLPTRSGWLPLQSEGGHVTLAATSERQSALLHRLWETFPHVSAERLLSGPGLPILHHALASLDGVAAEMRSPVEVTEQGVAGSCERCRETLDLFCALLGTVAGNLVLTLGAKGGLYIGGGIVPQLGDYFFQSPFRRAFEWRGRFSDYLAEVPVYVIAAEEPALRGAAAAFASLEQGLGIECLADNH